jgi:hypothetical protein
MYTLVFSYPLYVKQHPEDPNFAKQALLAYMPQNLKVDTEASIDAQGFQVQVKRLFAKFYIDRYKALISDDRPFDPSALLQHEPLRQMVKKWMYAVVAQTEPASTSFVLDDALSAPLYEMARMAPLPKEFIDEMWKSMRDIVIGPLRAEIDVAAIRKIKVLEALAGVLTASKLNVVKNMEQVESSIAADPLLAKRAGEARHLLEEAAKAVAVYDSVDARQNEGTDEHRYKTVEDYFVLVNSMSFKDFRHGFNVPYFRDVTDSFYGAVSEAVNLQSPNVNNLFYHKQKSFRAWRIAMVLSIIALFILLCRSLLSVYVESVKASRKEVDWSKVHTCDREAVGRQINSVRKTNTIIRIVMPILIFVFFAAIIVGMNKQMRSIFDFNVDIIESNTNDLRANLDTLHRKLENIAAKLDIVEQSKRMEEVTAITSVDKFEIFETLKKISDKFEKGNFIVETAKRKMPFPYTDIITNALMLVVVAAVVLYALLVLSPHKQLSSIRELYHLQEDVDVAGPQKMKEISENVAYLEVCNEEFFSEIETGAKWIGVSLAGVLLLFLITKIIVSSNDYKFGLYNSRYYRESRPYRP